MTIKLPNGYRPTDSEPFMNPLQTEYFRQKLIKWRQEIAEDSHKILQNMQNDNNIEPDIADVATNEAIWATELKLRERELRLIAKIDRALKKIEQGTYGYCEETGEPIGIRRLDARPIATLSIEVQQRYEQKKKWYDFG